MNAKLERRRFLTIMGAATALGFVGGATPETRLRHVWRGFALGGIARVELYDSDPARARLAGSAIASEIKRLEAVFSLNDEGSELARLNRAGRIERPSLDLVAVLGEARAMHDLSAGAFDPTVQPLWRLYARHFASPGASPAGPPSRDRERALSTVGFEDVDIGARRIVLGRRGAALTLNGIAQGAIADRLASLLRDGGHDVLLIDTGEIVAGRGRNGEPVVIDAVRRLRVRDRAVATSAASGTVFEPTGRFHHLFDPSNGTPASALAAVTVTASSALLADAASTALAVTTAPGIAPLVRRIGGIEAHLAWPDGRLETFAA